MMARSSRAPSIGRIQKRKTNFSKSSLSTCNARPVHTDGPCVDGSELARRIFTSQAWSVRPCVRPLSAVHMTAGHSALRVSGPGHKPAFENAMALVGCPDRMLMPGGRRRASRAAILSAWRARRRSAPAGARGSRGARRRSPSGIGWSVRGMSNPRFMTSTQASTARIWVGAYLCLFGLGVSAIISPTPR